MIKTSFYLFSLLFTPLLNAQVFVGDTVFRKDGVLKNFKIYDAEDSTFLVSSYNDAKVEVSIHQIKVIPKNNFVLGGGWEKKYYKNGKVAFSCNFNMQHQYEGLSKSYYPNGKIKTESNFKKDDKNGLSVEYYKKGAVFRKGNYEDDMYEGLWESFYENGTIKQRGKYSKGSPRGEWFFFNKKGQEIRRESFN